MTSSNNKAEAARRAEESTSRVQAQQRKVHDRDQQIAAVDGEIAQLQNDKAKASRDRALGKPADLAGINDKLADAEARRSGLVSIRTEEHAALAPLFEQQCQAEKEWQEFEDKEDEAEAQTAFDDAKQRRTSAWDNWIAASAHFDAMKARLNQVQERINSRIVRTVQMPIVAPERVTVRH